jgi:hypothetical protein
MRTTLDIADDVLEAAREFARREKKSLGEVVSELARRALTAPPSATTAREPEPFHGFRPFGHRGGVVTNETVDRLRDDDAY